MTEEQMEVLKRQVGTYADRIVAVFPDVLREHAVAIVNDLISNAMVTPIGQECFSADVPKYNFVVSQNQDAVAMNFWVENREFMVITRTVTVATHVPSSAHMLRNQSWEQSMEALWGREAT